MFYCPPLFILLLIIIIIVVDLHIISTSMGNTPKSGTLSIYGIPNCNNKWAMLVDTMVASIATIDIFRLFDNDNDSIAAIVLPHEGSITTRQLPESPIRNPAQLSHSAIPNNPCCAESPIDSGSSQYHGIPISLGTERMGRAPVYQSCSRQSSSRGRFSQHSY